MSNKKSQFSKWIICALWIAFGIVFGIIVYGTIVVQVDTTGLVTIAERIIEALAVAYGFYYWKAKNENRSKHAMNLVREFADKYGIENVVSLAETVLKD